MDEHTRAAVKGGGKGLLSKAQKRELCMLAAEAYKHARADGTAPDPAEDGMSESVAFNVWRRCRQHEAVGLSSLRDAHNDDYLTLKVYWLRKLGRENLADKKEALRLGEKYTWAKRRLESELKDAADVLPEGRRYIEGFLRNKRGVSLADADVSQIWQAIYTLRRRSGQLRRKVKS